MIEPAALPGTKLKAERERRGLSAQKAADEMHLDRWVIDALEADDYQRIGPTVYAKGHLKKYAALLGLPTGEILAAFESHPPARASAAAAGPSMLLSTRDDAPSSAGSSAMKVGAGVAVALAVGLLWWRPWHPRAKAPSAPPPAAMRQTAPADKPIESGIVATASATPVPAEIPVPTPAANPAVASGTDTSTTPVPGAGRARLRLSFSADSWVDIHDASGKRTFAGNGLANSVKTLSGTAPLRVYLGAGSGVQLEINDRAVAIGPQFFAGDVARFEAGADGVLRRDSRPDQTHGAPPRSPRPPG
ncbi:MAG TPA: RodZ domain-containing protein [Steroidobacteraceae bacterium]|jgi:cytoskeleton protein RodZ